MEKKSITLYILNEFLNAEKDLDRWNAFSDPPLSASIVPFSINCKDIKPIIFYLIIYSLTFRDP